MPFAIDYFLLAYLTVCGVIQLAAIRNGLKGLWLTPIAAINVLIGIALLIGPFLWFFIAEPRNVPDTGAGLDGNTQAMLFAGAAAAAIATSLALTSLIRLASPSSTTAGQGIDALTGRSYASAFRDSLRRIAKR